MVEEVVQSILRPCQWASAGTDIPPTLGLILFLTACGGSGKKETGIRSSFSHVTADGGHLMSTMKLPGMRRMPCRRNIQLQSHSDGILRTNQNRLDGSLWSSRGTPRWGRASMTTSRRLVRELVGRGCVLDAR